MSRTRLMAAMLLLAVVLACSASVRAAAAAVGVRPLASHARSAHDSFRIKPTTQPLHDTQLQPLSPPPLGSLQLPTPLTEHRRPLLASHAVSAFAAVSLTPSDYPLVTSFPSFSAQYTASVSHAFHSLGYVSEFAEWWDGYWRNYRADGRFGSGYHSYLTYGTDRYGWMNVHLTPYAYTFNPFAGLQTNTTFDDENICRRWHRHAGEEQRPTNAPANLLWSATLQRFGANWMGNLQLFPWVELSNATVLPPNTDARGIPCRVLYVEYASPLDFPSGNVTLTSHESWSTDGTTPPWSLFLQSIDPSGSADLDSFVIRFRLYVALQTQRGHTVPVRLHTEGSYVSSSTGLSVPFSSTLDWTLFGVFSSSPDYTGGPFHPPVNYNYLYEIWTGECNIWGTMEPGALEMVYPNATAVLPAPTLPALMPPLPDQFYMVLEARFATPSTNDAVAVRGMVWNVDRVHGKELIEYQDANGDRVSRLTVADAEEVGGGVVYSITPLPGGGTSCTAETVAAAPPSPLASIRAGAIAELFATPAFSMGAEFVERTIVRDMAVDRYRLVKRNLLHNNALYSFSMDLYFAAEGVSFLNHPDNEGSRSLVRLVNNGTRFNILTGETDPYDDAWDIFAWIASEPIQYLFVPSNQGCAAAIGLNHTAYPFTRASRRGLQYSARIEQIRSDQGRSIAYAEAVDLVRGRARFDGRVAETFQAEIVDYAAASGDAGSAAAAETGRIFFLDTVAAHAPHSTDSRSFPNSFGFQGGFSGWPSTNGSGCVVAANVSLSMLTELTPPQLPSDPVLVPAYSYLQLLPSVEFVYGGSELFRGVAADVFVTREPAAYSLTLLAGGETGTLIFSQKVWVAPVAAGADVAQLLRNRVPLCTELTGLFVPDGGAATVRPLFDAFVHFGSFVYGAPRANFAQVGFQSIAGLSSSSSSSSGSTEQSSSSTGADEPQSSSSGADDPLSSSTGAEPQLSSSTGGGEDPLSSSTGSGQTNVTDFSSGSSNSSSSGSNEPSSSSTGIEEQPSSSTGLEDQFSSSTGGGGEDPLSSSTGVEDSASSTGSSGANMTDFSSSSGSSSTGSIPAVDPIILPELNGGIFEVLARPSEMCVDGSAVLAARSARLAASLQPSASPPSPHDDLLRFGLEGFSMQLETSLSPLSPDASQHVASVRWYVDLINRRERIDVAPQVRSTYSSSVDGEGDTIVNATAAGSSNFAPYSRLFFYGAEPGLDPALDDSTVFSSVASQNVSAFHIESVPGSDQSLCSVARGRAAATLDASQANPLEAVATPSFFALMLSMRYAANDPRSTFARFGFPAHPSSVAEDLSAVQDASSFRGYSVATLWDASVMLSQVPATSLAPGGDKSYFDSSSLQLAAAAAFWSFPGRTNASRFTTPLQFTETGSFVDSRLPPVGTNGSNPVGYTLRYNIMGFVPVAPPLDLFNVWDPPPSSAAGALWPNCPRDNEEAWIQLFAPPPPPHVPQSSSSSSSSGGIVVSSSSSTGAGGSGGIIPVPPESSSGSNDGDSSSSSSGADPSASGEGAGGGGTTAGVRVLVGDTADGLSATILAAVISSVLVGLCLLALLGFVLMRRRARGKKDDEKLEGVAPSLGGAASAAAASGWTAGLARHPSRAAVRDGVEMGVPAKVRLEHSEGSNNEPSRSSQGHYVPPELAGLDVMLDGAGAGVGTELEADLNHDDGDAPLDDASSLLDALPLARQPSSLPISSPVARGAARAAAAAAAPAAAVGGAGAMMSSGSDHAGRVYPVLRNPAVQSGGDSAPMSPSRVTAPAPPAGSFLRSGPAMMTSGANFVAPALLVGEDGFLPPLSKAKSLSPLAPRSTPLTSGRDTEAPSLPARRPLPPLAPLGQRGAMMTSGVVHTSRLGNAAAREQAEHDRQRVRAPPRLLQDPDDLDDTSSSHAQQARSAPGAAAAAAGPDLPTLIWHDDPNGPDGINHVRINDAL